RARGLEEIGRLGCRRRGGDGCDRLRRGLHARRGWRCAQLRRRGEPRARCHTASAPEISQQLEPRFLPWVLRLQSWSPRIVLKNEGEFRGGPNLVAMTPRIQ